VGSKVIRNVTKIRKVSTNTLAGRVTSGTGPGEELTPSQARSLLNVYTTTQTDSAISTAVNSLVAGAPGLLDTLDELSAALGDDANFAATVTTALAGKVDSSSLSESIDDRVAALLVAGTNITITYNDAAGTLTVASTAGGLSGTGSVDNAALRADGTGGATLQSSAWIINDNLTASPNNTVNHACLEATGGTTNVSVSIKPKGSGAFSLSTPDGTATGGNARGANASDLQTTRSAATQVASGTASFLFPAINCTVSGSTSASGGNTTSVTGTRSFGFSNSSTISGNEAGVIGGQQHTVSGEGSFIGGGFRCTASGTYSQVMGADAIADRYAQYTHAPFRWSGGYNRHGYIRLPGGGKTTNATPTALTLDNVSSKLSIGSGSVCAIDVHVIGVKSDGSAVAEYRRRVRIKNVGGTTSLVGSVETVGTDYEDNASTDVTVTANDTTDILEITVTGIAAETWRWYFLVEGGEIAYGT